MKSVSNEQECLQSIKSLSYSLNWQLIGLTINSQVTTTATAVICYILLLLFITYSKNYIFYEFPPPCLHKFHTPSLLKSVFN